MPLHKQVATLRAVDGVSFTLARGRALGLVGESGCGKTTTALAVLRMLEPTSGRIVFDGEDITRHDRERMRPLRRRMQMVYQDPYGSLNPRMTARDIVAEPLVVHGVPRAEHDDRVAALLRTVGLLPDMAERYPQEFSGGQRQRIGIARALALQPALLVCDEPVSALDMSIQSQIVNEFVELQQRLGLTYLFIAHDLAVVRRVSDRIAVMVHGRIVEIGPRDSIYGDALHPYTQALLAAVPVADPVRAVRRAHTIVSGEVPSAMQAPAGCGFHLRCPRAQSRCRNEVPPMRELVGGRAVACHLVQARAASDPALPR